MTAPDQPGVPEYGTPEYERWYASHFPGEYAASRARNGQRSPDGPNQPKRPRRRMGYTGWVSAHPAKAALTGIGVFLAVVIAIGVAVGGGAPKQTPSDNAAAAGVATRTRAAVTSTSTRPAHSPTPTVRPTDRVAPTPTSAFVTGHGVAMPNHTLTPGAVLAGATTAQVCTPGWASAHRDVPASEAKAVFTAYRIPYARRASYELDHLISLELGGSNAVSNLWPQPQTENDTNGPDKDALENHLHGLVCSGQLALGTAQHSIAADWVAAWSTYERVRITQPAPTVAPTRPPAPKTTAAPAPPRTTAPPKTTAPPPPRKTTAPPPVEAACHPLTNSGNCYEPGEFCRASDHGVIGVAGDGKTIKCEDNDGWRWEPI